MFVFLWLGGMFWLPPVVLALAPLGYAPQANIAALLTCIGLSVLLWIIPYQQIYFGAGMISLYPVTLFVSEMIAWQSLWFSTAGQLSWKGRKVGRLRWRLL